MRRWLSSLARLPQPVAEVDDFEYVDWNDSTPVIDGQAFTDWAKIQGDVGPMTFTRLYAAASEYAVLTGRRPPPRNRLYPLVEPFGWRRFRPRRDNPGRTYLYAVGFVS